MATPSRDADQIEGQDRAKTSTYFAEAAVLAIATAVFLISVLPHLGNHPAITDDEIWVVSASDKLARAGVFGSDMFSGFFGADRNYFFNLPAHHFVIALVFKILGAGLLQARVVGVVYGLATIFLTYAAGRRLFGPVAAAISLVLLLFLRLNMGFDTGLPLQELSASIRYDLAPVPFVLAGFLILLGGSSFRRLLFAGALFGIATLFQFYGFFALVAAAAFVAWTIPGARARLLSLAALAVPAALVCLPYAVFAGAHIHDFHGQVDTIAERADFTSPAFYARNFVHEVDRFVRPLGFKEVPKGADPRLVDPRYLPFSEAIRRRPSAKIAILVGFPAALIFIGWKAIREKRREVRLLFSFLLTLPLQYALLDQLKLYTYWVLVVPFFCIALAPLLTTLLRRPPGDRKRFALATATALIALAVFTEGAAARVSGLRTASKDSDYAAMGRAIHAEIPPGARVVGSTSLWWSLRDTDYRSYFLFFYLTSPRAREYRTTVDGFLDGFNPQYLVLTRFGAEELAKHLSPADLAAYNAYLKAHATLVQRLEGPDVRSYGYVEIWRFNPTTP